MSTLKEKAGLNSKVNFVVGRVYSGKTIFLKNLLMESLKEEDVRCFYRSAEETKARFLENLPTIQGFQFDFVDSIRAISAGHRSPTKHYVFVDSADLLTLGEIESLVKLSALDHWTIFISANIPTWNRSGKPSLPAILANAFPVPYSVCTTKIKADELTLNNKERFKINFNNGLLVEVEDKEEIEMGGYNECYPIIEAVMACKRPDNFVGSFEGSRIKELTAALVYYVTAADNRLLVLEDESVLDKSGLHRLLLNTNGAKVTTLDEERTINIDNRGGVKEVLLNFDINDNTGKCFYDSWVDYFSRRYPNAKIGVFTSR